jgi:hypothetical protein
MQKLLMATCAILLVTSGLWAQKSIKPWVEWSQKEAQQILTESPWSHTQTETDTSEMFYSPTSQGSSHMPGDRAASSTSSSVASSQSRTSRGAVNQATHVNYRIRFFTARPVRQAFVRLMEAKQSEAYAKAKDQLDQFANLHSNDWIIVAVAAESDDQRFLGPVMQAFSSATTDTLKNNTYLERKDGKRIFLSEYVPPGNDGFGARFIFPRNLDGHPFLDSDSGEVRFSSDYSTSSAALKLNMRFKVAEMVYNGQLEY